MTKVIGITGGVGAGKSTVLEILKEDYNAQIIQADHLAHELMMPNEVCYQPIIEAFGEEIVSESGEFDKKALSNLIFKDNNKREQMNQIVHPAVKARVREMIQQSTHELIIVEAALLIEANFREICDEFWYVYVSTQERVKRLYEQRGYSEVKSYSVIQNQLSHREFCKNCEHLIDNGETIEYTKEQIAHIMKGENIS
jgi:dephospho-CoA kinase